MFKMNGKIIRIDQDLVVGEGDEAITYPADSLKSAELRAELGIVEEPDHVRPDDRLYFVSDNGDGSYTKSPRPREQLNALVWSQIKARREQVKSGGVKVGDKWFHSDADSRVQQMGLVMMGDSIPANMQWKTMDGSFVIMTRRLAAEIFQAVAMLDMHVFAAAEKHRAAMAEAENPFEYDFSTGWPASYSAGQ